MAEGLADTKAKIRDLDDLLRKALHDKHKLGQSKQNLLWLQVWHKMQPHRVKPCSDALGIMPSIPESHMRNYSNTGQAKFQGHIPCMLGHPLAMDTCCPLCRGVRANWELHAPRPVYA